MQQTINPSLQELRRQTEQTRAGLTNTVEQLKTTVSETASDLRHRISPEAIKAEVSDYVRSRGQQIIQDVTAAAHRNPMQAVAVGASVAYPLLRLARAIPLPVLMLGAGVFFASSKAGQSATQKASDLVSDLSDSVRQRSQDLSEQVGSSIKAATDVAADKLERAADTVSMGSDRIHGSVAAAAAGLNSAGNEVQIPHR
jgi:F0F1-type ATP synthase membrane subunit b/b'